MQIYALHACVSCRRGTDHYIVNVGRVLELHCDVCEEVTRIETWRINRLPAVAAA